MRSIKFTFLPLLLVLALSAEATSGTEIDGLLWENRFLKSELQLARTHQIYAVFDLMEKKIQIKARGVVLKEFPIKYFKIWGAPIHPEPNLLVKKTAFLKPKRIKIKPKKKDEESISELYDIENNEMPVRYRLHLNNSIWLYIRPQSDGILSETLTMFACLKSYMIRPFVALWNVSRGQTFSEMEIYLSEKDTGSLYPSLPEKTRCILLGFKLAHPGQG